MTTPFIAVDHIQLTMPAGEEDRARAFYAGVLGMVELPKPSKLAIRGGCWFTSGDVEIHLGVEEGFRPARKAHPGLVCSDYEGLLARLRSSEVEVREDEERSGRQRAYVHDPFGNRLELVKTVT